MDEKRRKGELNRIHRIEGQIRAVSRMIERGDDDPSIDIQLRAIQSAIHALRVARFQHSISSFCSKHSIEEALCEEISKKFQSFLR